MGIWNTWILWRLNKGPYTVDGNGSTQLMHRSRVLLETLTDLTDVDMVPEVEGADEAVKTVAMDVVVVMDPRGNAATTMARRVILRERVGHLEGD